MDEELKALKEAAEISPDNIPVRILYLKSLFKNSMYAEASEECGFILKKKPGDLQVMEIYSYVSWETGKYSRAEVLLEEIFSKNGGTPKLMLLYAKVLFRQGEKEKAARVYRDLLVENPGFRDAELDESSLRSAGDGAVMISEEEDDTDDDFDGDFSVEKPKIAFKDVGGMEYVKEQIRRKIILPLEKPEIYAAYGKKAGGGILLYGPPGCGKTYVAKATAGEINSSFIAVGLEDVLDMWLGESEKKIHKIFEAARRRAPCVLFFDEIDALGAKRTGRQGQGAARTDINQFLSELDGIKAENDGVLVLGATNMPWTMDPAFRRPGRFDRVIFVPPPDEQAREDILKLHAEGKPAENIDFRAVSKKTKDFSGADLRGLLDHAIEEKIEESIRKGTVQKIKTDDLLKSLKKVKPTTGEWLATARNHALYSNTDGIYDDVAAYLGLK